METRTQAIATHRRLALAYREMAGCWRSLLASLTDAEQCLADAVRHERAAELLERSADPESSSRSAGFAR